MDKLLFIPLDYELSPQRDWYDAFCKRFQCRYYTNIVDAIEFDPKVVMMQSGSIRRAELMVLRHRLKNAIIAQWDGDCRKELLEPVMRGKSLCDMTLLAAGIGQKQMYEEALGHPVHYLQHAVGNVKYPIRNNFLDKKITFIGNNYDQFEGAKERSELCEMLSKEYLDFRVYGSGFDDPKYNNCHSTHPSNKLQLYNESYISISSNIFNDIEGYWSDRPLEIMAAGSCCLMRYVPNLEKTFVNGFDCVFYKDNNHAMEMIKVFLENESLRNKIATQGQKTVMQYHTYDYRVEEIINLLK